MVTLSYFYPRPPRGGRPYVLSTVAPYSPISIHALREEGDDKLRTDDGYRTNFYPRPPRGGRPMNNAITALTSAQFLSTPSARRATERPAGPYPDACNFYPRPPRGGRHQACGAARSPGEISIHALREEGDTSTASGTLPGAYFYPRPPRGGRPQGAARPRGGGYFYPRPPRGGRLTTLNYPKIIEKFLSTPSARRATRYSLPAQVDRSISIHALREEGDLLSMGIVPGMCLFLSTPSARRATLHRGENGLHI